MGWIDVYHSFACICTVDMHNASMCTLHDFQFASVTITMYCKDRVRSVYGACYNACKLQELQDTSKS